MGYFPFFMDISGRSCVIVGGGTVALRKAEKLYPFSPRITVIAPEIAPEFSLLKGLRLEMRPFRDSDIAGAFLVIAATDDPAVNERIYHLCRQRQILVNSVDDPAHCTFYFPALVHQDDITVGISTAGTSPVMARYLRQQTEALLDRDLLGTAAVLKKWRPYVKAHFGTAAQRLNAMDALMEHCLASEELPDDAAILLFLEELYETDNRNP